MVDASQVILYDLAPLKESSRRQNGALDTFFFGAVLREDKMSWKIILTTFQRIQHNFL